MIAVSGLPKYCPIFHFPSSLRSSVTGVTSHIFSIISWFRLNKRIHFLKAHHSGYQVQHSTAQYSTVLPNTAQYSPLQSSAAQHSLIEYSRVQPRRAQYSTFQLSTAQYSPVQSITAKKSPLQPSCSPLLSSTTFTVQPMAYTPWCSQVSCVGLVKTSVPSDVST